MEKRFEVKDEIVLGQYEVMAIVRNYLIACAGRICKSKGIRIDNTNIVCY